MGVDNFRGQWLFWKRGLGTFDRRRFEIHVETKIVTNSILRFIEGI